tara:strand:- start:49998 stop:51872 length:1875 start_codon:yes stop_codon:yes gene_type:complete
MSKPTRSSYVLTLLLIVPITAIGNPKKIERLIEAGKYSEAKPLIEVLLVEEPDNAYQIYNHALTYYAEGNYEEAIVLWEKVRVSPDEELSTKAMAQIGNASFRISERIKAEGRLEDATIPLRRAHHSLESASQRDSNPIAAQNYNFVSTELVQHLVQQGDSKIENAKKQGHTSERRIILYRAALADYEEALAISPDDPSLNELVDKTRQLMTSYLLNVGNKKLGNAQKRVDSVNKTYDGKKLNSETGKELQRAEGEIMNSVANFADAKSVDSKDESVDEAVSKSEEHASELLTEIADMWLRNSESHGESMAKNSERYKEIQNELKTEKDKEVRKALDNERKQISKNQKKLRTYKKEQKERAYRLYDKALQINPDNMLAYANKSEMDQLKSEELESKADAALASAEKELKKIQSKEPKLEELRERLAQSEEAKEQEKLENAIAKIENDQATMAQRAIDPLIQAKTDLEQASRLDFRNESALEKLNELEKSISENLELAADLQIASAEALEAADREDQAIVRKELAIKNYDSAQALSQDSMEKEALQQKVSSARNELVEQRNERARRQAAAEAQQPNQPSETNDPNSSQEITMEYKERMRFAENTNDGGEFGKFDTKAMKKVVKDW